MVDRVFFRTLAVALVLRLLALEVERVQFRPDDLETRLRHDLSGELGCKLTGFDEGRKV